MPGLVRLEWRRDPRGYDLRTIPAESAKGLEHRREQVRQLAQSMGIPEPATQPSGAHDCLFPKSRKPEPYCIEGTGNQLFLRLANTSCTPEGVQDFANEWGLLTPTNDYQGVEEFYGSIRGMQLAADLLLSAEPLQEIKRLGMD